MSSVKESLRHSIEQLSDKEAHEILTFIQNRHRIQGHTRIIMRLSSNPTFTVPTANASDFQPVLPISGKGRTASSILVEERR